MLKRPILICAVVALCASADAVTVRKTLSLNPDSTIDTAFPLGNKPISGSTCSTFTCDDIGDAVADIDEVSITETLIATSGTSDNAGDLGLAYQTIDGTGDAQITARVADIATWIGPVENYTQFGIGIREAIGQNEYFAHCLLPKIGVPRFKRGTVGSLTDEAGATVASPEYLRLSYDLSATALICSHANATEDTFTQIGTTESKTLTCDPTCLVYAYGISHSGNTVTATVDNIDITDTLDTPEEPPEDYQRQGIYYFADWETGEVQARSNLHDGGFYNGMAPPLNGTCTPISTTQGGVGGLASNHYSRVMTTTAAGIPAHGGGSNVLRQQLHYDCDYNPFNSGPSGDIGGPLDKARTSLHGTADADLTWDEYIWIGFSMYFPADTEEETAGAWNIALFETTNQQGGNSSVTWYLHDHFDMTIKTQSIATSIQMPQPEGTIVRATLDLEDYLGTWTPVVIRIRQNPFVGAGPHATSGISGSTGEEYVGDRGSLEVWVDEVKVVDYQGPLGSVPAAAGWYTTHEYYKGGWKKRTTSVEGPMTLYLEGPYIGFEADGAGYRDVHPAKTICTDDCP